MSGGVGSRLWPISDKEKPKQFHSLVGNQSMLQQTVERFKSPLFKDKTVLLANVNQVELIDKQLEGSDYLIIAEPVSRNTAAAAIAAALYVASETVEGDDLILLAPADHVISEVTAFHEVIQKAKDIAQDSYIVTFGITPDKAETGYGYIKRGEELSSNIYRAQTFEEKPNLDTATKYYESKQYDWNAGIFLFSARSFLDEISRLQPEMLRAVKASFSDSKKTKNCIALTAEAFSQAPSISIDYAVMEKTNKAAVAPCDIGWNDIGSYEALRDIRKKLNIDCYPANSKCINTENSLVISDDPQVNIIGLDNIGVIVNKGRVLVLNLDHSQDVKKLL
jgi:mannose-1-phosphate guanylyltransferase/mannose-6-phosphate isomerase